MLVVVYSLAAVAQDEAPAADDPDVTTTSVSFNDDFELRYWATGEHLPDFPDEAVLDYVEQVNRLNAALVSGRWSLAMQVDEVALFANRYILDGELVVEHPLTTEGLPSLFPPGSDVYVNLEKVRAGYDAPRISVQLGDSYAAFGRGIALNLNRNVDIDIDTSVQGAKVVYRPGAWDLSLVAGQANRQQVFQDNPNELITGDYRHTIAGLRVERFGLGPANIGAHGVVYDFVDETGWAAGFDELGTAPDVVVGGLTTELVGVGGIDWFVEGDVFGFGPDQTSLEEDPPDTGFGVYGSAVAYPGPFVLLLEGKGYDQAERVNAELASELYEVAVAPTLEYERVVTEDSGAALNSLHIAGGRAQLDWIAIPGILVPNATMGVFRDTDLTGAHFNGVPETIVHPIAGVEWIDGELAVLANVGHRWDLRDGGEEGDRQLHGDLSWNFPVPGNFVGYLSAYGEWFRWGAPDDGIPKSDFVELETSLTFTWDGTVSLTGFLDHSTDELVVTSSPGNLSDTWYTSAELQVKPGDAWTIKALYGAQKAGIRCAGGQCRKMPGFEGARMSVVGTF